MFRIGEFARLGSVSVPSLRHYHERGLLVPAVVDRDTGYRWYSAAQLTRLSRIVALKELGFTLDQIEDVIAQVTESELRRMLMLRRAQIETDLAMQQDRLARVDARIRAIERNGAMPEYEIVIKALPAEHVAVLGGSPASWDSDDIRAVLEPAYTELSTVLDAQNVDVVGTPFCFYEGDPDDGDFMAYCALPIPDATRELPSPALVADLPAVEEALTVVVADVRIDTFVDVYSEFARWAEEHDCDLVGAHRDRLMTLERPASDRDVVLELVQQIQRAGGGHA
jgi:DNA-binding transcriptional MerR regulator